jgi:hypothetical protein
MTTSGERQLRDRLQSWADTSAPTASADLVGFLQSSPSLAAGVVAARTLRVSARAGVGAKALLLVGGFGMAAAAAFGARQVYDQTRPFDPGVVISTPVPTSESPRPVVAPPPSSSTPTPSFTPTSTPTPAPAPAPVSVPRTVGPTPGPTTARPTRSPEEPDDDEPSTGPRPTTSPHDDDEEEPTRSASSGSDHDGGHEGGSGDHGPGDDEPGDDDGPGADRVS